MRDEAGDAAESSPGAAPVRTIRWPFLGGRSNRSTILPAASALLLEHSSDGVLIADMRARGQPIVHVNPAFESITGYAAAEVLGKNCRYLQGSDRLQPEITEIRAALAELRPCSVTLRNYRRDGTMFRNALRLVPLRDDAGQVTHFIGLIRDVTHAAGIDRLTGLLDRYGLLDRLAAMDAPGSSALLMVKLDILRFHDVNSGFGYNDVGILTAPDGRAYAIAVMIGRTQVGIPTRQKLMNDAVRAVIDYQENMGGD